MKKIKLVEEFKTFIARGNVLDMAVGVVIGSAFTAIVNSLVADLLTPFIGLILKAAGVDDSFKEWAPGGFGVGSFINSIISFFLIALSVFFLIKIVNSAQRLNRKKEEEAEAEVVAEEPAAPTDVELLTEIRDLLAKK